MEHKFCEYGCEQESKYQLRNGKCCCSQSYNSCPAIKKKNSNSIKQLHKNGTLSTNQFDGKRGWAKGLTKETDERVKKFAEKISQTLKINAKKSDYKPRGCAVWTTEKRKEWSKKQSINTVGGRCKWHKIDGIYVQGTWELNLAKKMNKLNISWEKLKNYKDSFEYYLYDKKRHYTPDFYIEEINKLLEIKGYWRNYDVLKMKEIFKQYPILNKKF